MRIIKRGADARSALKEGIDLAADCIRVTLGPTGRNAVLGRQNVKPIITNDGATIAQNIEAEDPFVNQGVWLVKEAATLTDISAGDGTTTTAVLLQRIVGSVFERMEAMSGSLVKSKVDAIQLKKEIEEWCEKAIQALKKKSKKMTTKDIRKVALVSGEYEWIADLVSRVFKEIGPDGYVTIEEGRQTKFLTFKGIELNAGYHSEYYINNDKGECVLENPRILVSNQPFEVTALLPLIAEMTTREESNLILIAPDFSRDSLARLTTTKVKVGLNAVAIRLPQTNDELFKDISALTQAKFLDKNLFSKYEDFAKEFKFENLGQVEKAVIGNGYTRLIGGQGDTAERVKTLKKTIAETDSAFDRDKLEKRIAFLSGGMATIQVGGDSETEKTYLKLKIEDAVNAVQGSFKEGVARGGGIALKEIAEELPLNILSSALRGPYEQIQENSGGMEIGEDVIDPVWTNIAALKSACSLAGLVITTEILSVYKVEDKSKNFDATYGAQD